MLQTSILLMKSLNKTEILNARMQCVLCFKRQLFFIIIPGTNCHMLGVHLNYQPRENLDPYCLLYVKKK